MVTYLLGKCIYCSKVVTSKENNIDSWDVDYMLRPFHISCFKRSTYIDLGNGSKVLKKLVPNGMSTGLKDINGYEILTGHVVSFNNYQEVIGIIGRMNKGLVVFRGNEEPICLSKKLIVNENIIIESIIY